MRFLNVDHWLSIVTFVESFSYCHRLCDATRDTWHMACHLSQDGWLKFVLSIFTSPQMFVEKSCVWVGTVRGCWGNQVYVVMLEGTRDSGSGNTWLVLGRAFQYNTTPPLLLTHLTIIALPRQILISAFNPHPLILLHLRTENLYKHCRGRE